MQTLKKTKFSGAHGTVSKMDYRLKHKANLSNIGKLK